MTFDLNSRVELALYVILKYFISVVKVIFDINLLGGFDEFQTN